MSRTVRRANLLLVSCSLFCISCARQPIASFRDPRFPTKVDSSAELIDALAHAGAGDRIVLRPVSYQLGAALVLRSKGTAVEPIVLECIGPGRAILDFAAEPEDKKSRGIEITGDYWQLSGIEVTHAGSFGINITGSHNTLSHCVARENRNTGIQVEAGGSYNVIDDCESFRNFDPKTRGENADGFAAKHEIGPGNIFRRCRAYQNADDGWDLWMSPHAVVIEDCVAFRNGYNIFHCEGFQGDGNGFKFGGNYVATPHIARRCVSIENPLHGFDQNHNIGELLLEDCVAIRCGKGFCFPELPRKGKVILRRDTSFGCMNVLEPEVVMEDCRWYADIPVGTLGPPPRPGHRDIKGAGEVPTTQPTPLRVPEGAPLWGRPGDTPATAPYPEP